MMESQLCLPNGQACDIFQAMERSGEQFGRLITAMVTPFNNTGDVIEPSRTIMLARHLADNKTTTIVVCGTTGESPTLDESERIVLQGTVKRAVESTGVLVIAGTSTYSTRESIHLSRRAQEEGVDGLLLVTPYYNKPSQEGLKRHFGAMIEETQGLLPAILYNVPSRTNVNIEPETVWWLAENYPPIVGLKEAKGLATEKDREHVDRILKEKPEGFTVWSGNDQDTHYFLTHGGFGIVSVASHVVGRMIYEMINLSVLANERSEFHGFRSRRALELNDVLHPLFQALFPPTSPEPSPVAIKEMLNQLGMHVGTVRLPLVEEPEDYKHRLQELLGSYAADGTLDPGLTPFKDKPLVIPTPFPTPY